jgi:ABC-type bacteriocin/lantibiotic exporter with double-glycine peptidase domain
MNKFKIYIKNNKLNSIIAFISSILLGILSFVLSEKLKLFFNEGIIENKLNVIEENLFIIFIIFLFVFILNILSSVINNLMNWRGAKNYNVFYAKKLFKTDYNYFLNKTSAAIWTNLNMSSMKVSGFYTSIIYMSTKIIEMTIYFYILIKINIFAGVFTLIAIPLILLTTLGVKNKMSEYQMKMLEKSRELSSTAIESFSSVKNIKVKNAYHFFLEKIRAKNEELNKAVIKSAVVENYWSYVSSLINSLVPITIIYLIMKFTNLLNISVGNIIVLYSFIPLFLSSFKSFYSLIMEFFSSKPYLKSLDELEKLDQENVEGIYIDNFESLETKNLKIKISEDRLLDIPDMNIKKSEKVLISGESGIGKSSFFETVLKLRNDYSGEIKINGIDLKKISSKSIRNIVGISFQGQEVYSGSIKENILLGKNEEDLSEIIEISELNEILNYKSEKRINNNVLSGGEKSRISLAQNLFKNPDLILIDESLSSVDEITESKILNKILSKFKNKTILCISHRNSSLKNFDREIKIGNNS